MNIPPQESTHTYSLRTRPARIHHRRNAIDIENNTVSIANTSHELHRHTRSQQNTALSSQSRVHPYPTVMPPFAPVTVPSHPISTTEVHFPTIADHITLTLIPQTLFNYVEFFLLFGEDYKKNLSPQSRIAYKKHWDKIDSLDREHAFRILLDRIKLTYERVSYAYLIKTMLPILDRMSQSVDFSKTIIAQSISATETCDDRVLLAINHLRLAANIDDIVNGKFDNKLPMLIQLARETFRIEQLNEIARSHTRLQFDVDEVEVYLGFQVFLSNELNIKSTIKVMNIPLLGKITYSDLKRAEQKVKINENKYFSEWLSVWEPFTKYIHRIAPEKSSEAETKRHIILENELTPRINKRIKALKLENIPDIDISIGKEIAEEITKNVNRELVHDVFSTRQCLDLIDNKYWRSRDIALL